MSPQRFPFVRALRSSLPGSHEWTERDPALLELAERQVADIDRLEQDIAANGVRVHGRGAEVVDQAFSEVRQGRVALGRLLGLVEIPSDCRRAPRGATAYLAGRLATSRLGNLRRRR